MNAPSMRPAIRPPASMSSAALHDLMLDILHEYDVKGLRADMLLRRYVHRHRHRLGGSERAKISRSVFNIIRWRRRLDYVASRILKTRMDGIEPRLRNVYRFVVFLIVHRGESVEYTCSLSDHMLSGLPDLRTEMRKFIGNLAASHEQLPMPNESKNAVQALSIIHSHPEWLVERLVGGFGREAAVRMMEFNNREPAVHVRVNTLKANRDEVQSDLENLGLHVESLPHAPLGLLVHGPVAAFNTPAFLAGAFEMQDEASQVFSEWCAPAPHHRVLDACCGSGGKTLYMSALMKNTGRIVAHDPNRSALAELRKRAARAGAQNIDIHPTQDFDRERDFDLVLIDAPCSGIGTLQRNPDIKWTLTPSDVDNLMAEQQQILHKFSGLVRQGGTLIYSTCTLLPEENEDQIERFLTSHRDFSMVHAASPFLDEKGYFQIRPDLHGMSGFFACKLKRT